MFEAFERDSKIINLAANGGLVLTAGQRQANRLLSLRRLVFNMPDCSNPSDAGIVSLDDWIRDCALCLEENKTPLTNRQYFALWEQIIEEDVLMAGGSLLSVPRAAQKAHEAHIFLTEHYGHEFPEIIFDSIDLQSFLRWRAAFLDICQKKNFCDPWELHTMAGEAILSGSAKLPGQVVLYGFDGVNSMRLRSIKSDLRKVGVQVDYEPDLTHPEGAKSVVRFPCNNMEDEIRSAARWVAKVYQDGQCAVGVLTPDLLEYGPRLEAAIIEELFPTSMLIGEGAGLVDLIMNKPLEKEGLVVAAMEILSVDHRIDMGTMSYLLRSPYLKGARKEAASRALLDREVRAMGHHKLTLSRLADVARGGGARGAGQSPIMADIFECMIDDFVADATRKPSEWAKVFAKRLMLVGTDEAVSGGREESVYMAWKDAVNTMVDLDSVRGEVSREEAMAILKRVVADTVFQPEGNVKPIMIMNMDEAAGQCFDYLWVAGMREGVFPTPAPINTFVPVSVQKETGMLRRELPQARKTWGRIFSSAPEIVASHPKSVDGCGYRPSPVIAQTAEGKPELAPEKNLVALLAGTAEMEIIVDNKAPRVPENTSVTGGTGIFKDQALCPARAFGHHRVAARGLDNPDVGIDNFMRGNLVHYALEHFWREVVDSDKLNAMDEQECTAVAEAGAEHALSFWEERRGVSLPIEFRNLEFKRVVSLVVEWLEVEKKRDTPFRVDKIEAIAMLEIGGIPIETRLDREDVLPDGTKVIIDYKTGRPTLSDWKCPRPSDPQVPIYGIEQGAGEIAALAFAVVRRGECKFVGAARTGGILPKVQELDKSCGVLGAEALTWEGLFDAWKDALSDLGQEFMVGESRVDPKHIVDTCKFCDLKSFCRIAEKESILEQAVDF